MVVSCGARLMIETRSLLEVQRACRLPRPLLKYLSDATEATLEARLRRDYMAVLNDAARVDRRTARAMRAVRQLGQHACEYERKGVFKIDPHWRVVSVTVTGVTF